MSYLSDLAVLDKSCFAFMCLYYLHKALDIKIQMPVIHITREGRNDLRFLDNLLRNSFKLCNNFLFLQTVANYSQNAVQPDYS